MQVVSISSLSSAMGTRTRFADDMLIEVVEKVLRMRLLARIVVKAEDDANLPISRVSGIRGFIED